MRQAGLTAEETLLAATAGGASCAASTTSTDVSRPATCSTRSSSTTTPATCPFASPGAVTGVFKAGEPRSRTSGSRQSRRDAARRAPAGVEALRRRPGAARRRPRDRARLDPRARRRERRRQVDARQDHRRRPPPGRGRAARRRRRRLPLAARRARATASRSIAQEPTLVPHRSVLENVFLGIESMRARRPRRAARCAGASPSSSRTRSSTCRRRLARTLTVADQQKVEILRAIAREARLIVMDEPTSALTADEAERLLEVVRRLRERGDDDHLRLALPRRGARARGHRHRPPRRAARADGAGGRGDAGDARRGDARPLARADLPGQAPPAGGRAGRALACATSPRTPASYRTSRSTSARARSSGSPGLIGSGRTEVARAIFGADRADAGEIEVEGKPVKIRGRRGRRPGRDRDAPGGPEGSRGC